MTGQTVIFKSTNHVLESQNPTTQMFANDLNLRFKKFYKYRLSAIVRTVNDVVYKIFLKQSYGVIIRLNRQIYSSIRNVFLEKDFYTLPDALAKNHGFTFS